MHDDCVLLVIHIRLGGKRATVNAFVDFSDMPIESSFKNDSK